MYPVLGEPVVPSYRLQISQVEENAISENSQKISHSCPMVSGRHCPFSFFAPRPQDSSLPRNYHSAEAAARQRTRRVVILRGAPIPIVLALSPIIAKAQLNNNHDLGSVPQASPQTTQYPAPKSSRIRFGPDANQNAWCRQETQSKHKALWSVPEQGETSRGKTKTKNKKR